MDPDKVLEELRAKVQRAFDENNPPEHLHEFLLELASDIDALDRWMATGGFTPKAWRAGARKTEKGG
jgi:hypothetical protein